jgi:drug/metabolite transporter (DMT)-like permease
MLTTATSQSFKWRGLVGVLLLFTGIALAVTFRDSSPWPAQTKLLMYALALVLGVGGSNLFGSFVYRRPLHTMKAQLLGSALMIVVLVIGKL